MLQLPCVPLPYPMSVFHPVASRNSSFEFNKELEITAMISIEGERIAMDVPVVTKGVDEYVWTSVYV